MQNIISIVVSFLLIRVVLNYLVAKRVDDANDTWWLALRDD